MTTIVASPPSFQSLPRLGWNGSNGAQGGFSAMSTEDVSRMFMPQRKVVTRSASSSSLASNSSASSTTTITPTTEAPQPNSLDVATQAKKKQRGGFWPVAKAEAAPSVTNARANGAVQPSNTNTTPTTTPKNGLQSAIPTQNGVVANGPRTANGMPPTESPAMLVLLPMNGTFERKQINVPSYPELLRIGRQTNAKTVPTPTNGFFDSKVLSRSHAEIWADKNGKVWIRDVKSSNGTFVNGTRLSPENRESEPHELRQHDSLELGIDIVSEDQKTIVHHKVSAKVEFAGIPNNSNNVLDLSFGDLDPSHGSPLLGSPMSSPMAHSRSQPGRPAGAPGGRGSTASSVAGTNISSVAQRHANYWGVPLNIEQLVKQVSSEMRAAKQQAADLEQANTFLHAMIPPDGSPVKLNLPKESLRQSNGRVRPPRVDHSARFVDHPPAPPPQQPLPEKPDSAKASSPTTAGAGLKRENTAKPPSNNLANSPTGTQQSQILQLLEQLNSARKEMEAQGTKVKQLEDMLKQERAAREAAEEKARLLEESAAARPRALEEVSQDAATAESTPAAPSSGTKEPVDTSELQQKLDDMLAQMKQMQTDLDQSTQRAESAEKERTSLGEMIQKYREEHDKQTTIFSKPSEVANEEEVLIGVDADTQPTPSTVSVKHDADPQHSTQPNGHVRAPSRLPEHLERAVATILKQSASGDSSTAQSAPYVSMLGVVLIGVGIMAYLNTLQKGEK